MNKKSLLLDKAHRLISPRIIYIVTTILVSTNPGKNYKELTQVKVVAMEK